MGVVTAVDFYANEKKCQYNKHDTGYKSLLYSKRAFIELLRSFVKHSWVEYLNEDNIIRINNKYILQDFEGKESDIVYKAKIGKENVIFYVLIELQSKVDFLMPYRLLLYMVEIWRDVYRDTPENIREQKGFRFPSVVPIVLYNGKYKWTASMKYKDIVNQNNVFEKFIPNFEYLLIDVNRYNEQKLLQAGNLMSSVFYIDQKRDTEEIFKRLKTLMFTLKNFDSAQL